MIKIRFRGASSPLHSNGALYTSATPRQVFQALANHYILANLKKAAVRNKN